MNLLTETAAERSAKITAAHIEYIAAKRELDASLKVVWAAGTRLGNADDREEAAHIGYIAAKKELDASLKVLRAAETRLGNAEDREEAAHIEYIAADRELDASLKVLMAAETRLRNAEDREERAAKKCEEMIRFFGKSNWDIALASLPVIRDS